MNGDFFDSIVINFCIDNDLQCLLSPRILASASCTTPAASA